MLKQLESHAAIWAYLGPADQATLVLYHKILADGPGPVTAKEVLLALDTKDCVDSTWVPALLSYRGDLSLFMVINHCYFKVREPKEVYYEKNQR